MSDPKPNFWRALHSGSNAVTFGEPILFLRNSTYLPVSGVARGESFRAFRLFPSLATDCAISPGGVGISVLGGEFGGRWEQSGFTTGPQSVVEKLSNSRFHNPLRFSTRVPFEHRWEQSVDSRLNLILTTLNVYSLDGNSLRGCCRYENLSFVGI